MEIKLKNLKENILKELSEIKDGQLLGELKNKYLGRKGQLNEILKAVKDLSEAEKPRIGKLANEIKQEEITIHIHIHPHAVCPAAAAAAAAAGEKGTAFPFFTTANKRKETQIEAKFFFRESLGQEE